MKYSELCKVYEALENTSKGLEKTAIISDFLGKIKEKPELIYLIKGEVFPAHNEAELGISQQLVIKAISRVTGLSTENVVQKFKETGDLGKTAEQLTEKKQQSSLFSTKLTPEKVLTNLQKLSTLQGQGTVDRKIGLVIELLNSATPIEAKYIIRTVLLDLKIGVGDGILRDAIVDYCFKPETITEKKEQGEIVQQAYDKSLDYAEVFNMCVHGGLKKLKSVSFSPGRPVKVMLFPKAKDVEDAFRIVGKPAAFEYKYDGFRMMISKTKEGKISIFTRRLDNVTTQFPDVVSFVKTHINAKEFIIDCEAVGFDPKTKAYQPFQAVSQRIKRKYHIEKLVKELPVEVNVFDCIYYNGKSLINEPFGKRRKLIEKIIKNEKYKIVLAKQIITSSEKQAQEFYDLALSQGHEGLMAKSLLAIYKPGARVGYAVKLKPEDNDFDLVITGAEYGTGKRAGWLTSFDLSCRDTSSGKLLEVGKASTGLKEKQEQGLSFVELTKKLKPLIISEDGRHISVKPQVVVMVQYQNIQKSPTYSSGYAMRFPRIKAIRPDRSTMDITSLVEIQKEVEGK